MSLTQFSISHRLGLALLRGVIFGLLSSGNSVAEARDLIWTASASQTSQAASESIPLPQLEKIDSKHIYSVRFLTEEEFQDTIRALELVPTFSISSSAKKQTQMIEEQLRQLQQKQSAPYQLTSTQLQTLKNLFSGFSKAELTTLNQRLKNQKSENPSPLNWHENRDQSATLEQISGNHLSDFGASTNHTTISSNSSSKQLAQSLSASSSASQLTSNSHEDAAASSTANLAQNEVDRPTREELIEQLSVPEPDFESILVETQRAAPAIALSVPSGFGGSQGQFFASLTFQEQTRTSDKSDAGFGFGLGLGNPEEVIGFDVIYSSFSTIRSAPFDTGSVSLKIHRRLSDTSSAAIGVENFIRYGDFDADINYFGSFTNIFALRENPTDLFNSLAVTVGLGSGRFREIDDIREGEETINIFGSAGLRINEQFSLLGTYTGNTLAVGVSVAPLRDIPLVITPRVQDLTGEFDPRFIVTVGYGTALF